MSIDPVGAAGTVLLSRLLFQSLPTIDVTAVVGASGAARAVGSLLSTVVFGGAVLYRYGGRLDGAVEASMRNPLLSVVYGSVAYGGVVFAFSYLYNQLGRIGVAAGSVSLVAVPLFFLLILVLGGVGFAVVGVWVTEALGTRDPWIGLVGVGGVSAAAWLLLPFAFGAGVWVAVAATGIGGPTRMWLHADSVRVEER